MTEIEQQLVGLARAALKSSPYGAVQSVTCHVEDGCFVLTGEVLTFFQKQQAQVTVANVPGVPKIVNRIHVQKH